MNEERSKILQMLSAGQITVDEAERLISAVEREQPSSSDGESRPKARPKYLRVVVKPQEGNEAHAPTVNVRVPMQLLRAGVRLASLIPVQARDQVNVAMREHGVQFDLSQIKPENLEELVDQLSDLTVDVDEHDMKVRVFCE